GGAIASKMFHACDDAIGTEGIALESDDLRASHGCAEVRIFAGAFNNAAPSRITGDVDHGGERPANAGGSRVLAGEALCGFFHTGIPGGGHGQRNREDRAISVNDVVGEKNGYVKAGFLDSEMLEPVDFFNIDEPQD